MARVRDTAQRLGVPLDTLPPPDAPFAYSVRGQLLRHEEWERSPVNLTTGDERGVPPSGLLEYYLARFNPLREPDDWLRPPAARLDIAAADWLRQQGASAEAIAPRQRRPHAQGHLRHVDADAVAGGDAARFRRARGPGARREPRRSAAEHGPDPGRQLAAPGGDGQAARQQRAPATGRGRHSHGGRRRRRDLPRPHALTAAAMSSPRCRSASCAAWRSRRR